MADMKRIKGRIAETIYPNGQGAITAEAHQALLLEMVDEINSKKQDTIEGGAPFSEQGNYPDLTAGDLAGRGESVPAEFGFRASGGKSIKDGRAYIKRIKGNSVVWNNMVDTRRYENGFTIKEGVKILQGHKYLLQRSAANASLYLIPVINGVEKYEMSILAGEYAKIFVSQYTDTTDARVYAEEYCGACVITDLTQMFQAGNEPSTIEEYEARKPIVADEYAYNEGEVIHMTAEGVKSIGDNAWNQYTAVRGVVNDQTGVFTPDSNALTMVDLVRCLPGEYYFNHIVHYNYRAGLHFYDENMNFIGVDGIWDSSTNNYSSGKKTIPAEAHYMRVGTPYDAVEQCMVTLVHSGWKQDTDAGYQPYWQDTLPLPIISKYFPDGMKKAGSAHDEIRFNKASGKWEAVQRIGSVDMGSLEWEVASNNRMIATALEDVIVRKDAANDTLLCAKYTNAYPSEVYLNTSDRIICSTNVGHIFVYDSAYTDAATFKAAMQGVILYYESNDWEWVELDAEDQNFRDYYNVADFGTEQSQSSVPSAPFSADIIYQFNAVDMIREHELEITELQSIIATMQAQLTSLINGGQ